MVDIIDKTIKDICGEIENRLSLTNWHFMSNEELTFELVLSILGSQVDFEIAHKATQRLKAMNLLHSPIKIFSKFKYETVLIEALSQPISCVAWIRPRKYRFYRTRAAYISDTIWNITTKWRDLRELLEKNYTEKKLRRELMKIVKGFGPKQASHFLRNIGYAKNLAVLDRHIIDYLKIKGIINSDKIFINRLSIYEIYEDLFINAVKYFDYPLFLLDQAIWIVMRVYKKEIVS